MNDEPLSGVAVQRIARAGAARHAAGGGKACVAPSQGVCVCVRERGSENTGRWRANKREAERERVAGEARHAVRLVNE